MRFQTLAPKAGNFPQKAQDPVWSLRASPKALHPKALNSKTHAGLLIQTRIVSLPGLNPAKVPMSSSWAFLSRTPWCLEADSQCFCKSLSASVCVVFFVLRGGQLRLTENHVFVQLYYIYMDVCMYVWMNV